MLVICISKYVKRILRILAMVVVVVTSSVLSEMKPPQLLIVKLYGKWIDQGHVSLSIMLQEVVVINEK